MPSFFLDANVIFSASLSERGQARALFDLAHAGHCTLFTSACAVEKARRNLDIK